MFVNKLDRAGASLPSSISSILAHRLHPAPMLLTLPVASFDPELYARGEPGIEGLVDLVKWEVWRWPTDPSSDAKPERLQLPTTESELEHHSLFPPSHPLAAQLLPAREALLDSLSLRSSDLESAILEAPADTSPYLSVNSSQIIPSLRSLVAKREILPVFCGAAAKHLGTELLMNYVGELLASPRDVRLEGAVESGAKVQMLAWKVMWDKRKGWMTFVRVYSGTSNLYCIRQIYPLFFQGVLHGISRSSTPQRTRKNVSPRSSCFMQTSLEKSTRSPLALLASYWVSSILVRVIHW